jgi:hypothetical protein
MEKAIQIISPISIFIWITFFVSIIALIKKNLVSKLVFLIILLNFSTDIITLYCIYHEKKFFNIYNIFFILNFGLWLYLFYILNHKKTLLGYLLVVFLVFSIFNLFFIEKQNLNYYTFIVGALFYLFSFTWLIINNLKNENLNYFTTNQYLLQVAPVLFFVGFTFLFGFRNYGLRDIIIFNRIDLYTFISIIVNVIYYLLLNIYIFKERKLNHA